MCLVYLRDTELINGKTSLIRNHENTKKRHFECATMRISCINITYKYTELIHNLLAIGYLHAQDSVIYVRFGNT